MKYRPTIGLEIHAELTTETKMFCSSRNNPAEEQPNTNVCPVCMAHPGALPVINREAVRQVLRVGTAMGGRIADYTEFDRKNYFYPDLPKNYQISQYKYPLIEGGELEGVELTRIHLEEDAARSSHHEGYSLIDFNRSGVPLMELVTEPVMHSSEEAVAFAKHLQMLLRYLGSSHANLEKGEMRVEANISVSDNDTFGTKVEVKNLNSFKAVEQAIEFEVKRQIEVIESGSQVVQETRGWDENKQITFSQRTKEDSHDYRYFPDPDIPKLKLSEIQEFSAELLAETLPELPWEKLERYKKAGVPNDAAVIIYANTEYTAFFDAVLQTLSEEGDIKLAANYFTSDLLGTLRSAQISFAEVKVSPESLSEIILMLNEGLISSRGAKDLICLLISEGGDPRKMAESNNLLQQSDENSIKEIVGTVLSENAEVVNEYKAGKETALKYLVGQGMKISKGSANPQMLTKVIKDSI